MSTEEGPKPNCVLFRASQNLKEALLAPEIIDQTAIAILKIAGDHDAKFITPGQDNARPPDDRWFGLFPFNPAELNALHKKVGQLIGRGVEACLVGRAKEEDAKLKSLAKFRLQIEC